MAITLVAHTIAAGTSSGATTSSIDTTGSNGLVLLTSNYSASETASTVSDNKSNLWNRASYRTNGGSAHNILCLWLADPTSLTVGSGHTFTVSGSSQFGVIGVLALGSTEKRLHGATTSSAESLAPGGSMTTNIAGGIAITGIAWGNSRTMSIDDSFTIADQVDWSSGNNMGLAVGYRIVTSTAVAPTWSWTTANPATTSLMILDGAAVSGGGGGAWVFVG